jgi:L-ectoine synthase
MIVRSVEEARGTEREVRGGDWTSIRLLLRGDGMGFSMSETVLEPGMEKILEYKHHLEACFCIEGEATVDDLSTGETFHIRPGTMYALDRHDRHRLTTRTRTRLVCVFSPALTGRETHDAEGSYGPPPEDA